MARSGALEKPLSKDASAGGMPRDGAAAPDIAVEPLRTSLPLRVARSGKIEGVTASISSCTSAALSSLPKGCCANLKGWSTGDGAKCSVTGGVVLPEECFREVILVAAGKPLL